MEGKPVKWLKGVRGKNYKMALRAHLHLVASYLFQCAEESIPRHRVGHCQGGCRAPCAKFRKLREKSKASGLDSQAPKPAFSLSKEINANNQIFAFAAFQNNFPSLASNKNPRKPLPLGFFWQNISSASASHVFAPWHLEVSLNPVLG